MSGATLQVTLELPEPWVMLSERERDRLLRAGVYEATRARMRQLQAEIAECEQHMHRFEERYGMSLQRFEAEQLAGLDTFQVHEDYIDWFYWQTVLDDKRNLLASIQQVKVA
jgi:hypothetical protein